MPSQWGPEVLTVAPPTGINYLQVANGMEWTQMNDDCALQLSDWLLDWLDCNFFDVFFVVTNEFR